MTPDGRHGKLAARHDVNLRRALRHGISTPALATIVNTVTHSGRDSIGVLSTSEATISGSSSTQNARDGIRVGGGNNLPGRSTVTIGLDDTTLRELNQPSHARLGIDSKRWAEYRRRKLCRVSSCHGAAMQVTAVQEGLRLAKDVVYVPIRIPVCPLTCGERYDERHTDPFREGSSPQAPGGASPSASSGQGPSVELSFFGTRG